MALKGPYRFNPKGLLSDVLRTLKPQRAKAILNMHLAAFVTVLAFVVAFPIAISANDRPSDPFGNHTVKLNNDAPLVGIWEFLKDQLLLDRARFQSCNEQSNISCPEVSTLIGVVDEARQNQGKVLLGHLNRSINLLIKPAPGDWTGPLEVIKMRNGDCKSYSIAKYAAARLAGISPDQIRLVIVHNQRHNEDHMVAAVHQDEGWLILDNLTNLLLRDSEKTDYEPLAILDYRVPVATFRRSRSIKHHATQGFSLLA